MENFRTQKEIEADIMQLNVEAEKKHAEISKKKETLVLNHNEQVRKIIDEAEDERKAIKFKIMDINFQLYEDLTDAEKIRLRQDRVKHEFNLQTINQAKDKKIRALKSQFDRELMQLNDESRQVSAWMNEQKAPLKQESHEAWVARQREKETIEE